MSGPLRRISGIVTAAVLAGALLYLLHHWHALVTAWTPPDTTLPTGVEFTGQVVLLSTAVALLAWVVRRLVRRLSLVAVPYLGPGRAQVVSTLATVAAYALVLSLVAWAAGIDINGLALPGALTGVVIGIAAQASLGNVVNGLVILFTRPYTEGMSITARSPALVGGEYSGLITRIGLFYTVMRCGEREVRMPNSAMAQSTVIVRTDAIEVYIPVVVGPASDYAVALAALRCQIAAALPPDRVVTITLERCDAAGYTVGVQASVASPAEQERVAAAIAGAAKPFLVVPVGPPAGVADAYETQFEGGQPARPAASPDEQSRG